MTGMPEPVVVQSRRISDSWWGNAWNRTIDRYVNRSNRTGRGRTCLRSGAVQDLRIIEGGAEARVKGSRKTPYKVRIRVSPLSPERADRLLERCGCRFSDVSAMAAGRMPRSMEEALTADDGLFPSRNEISFACTCPDSTSMCKHVMAVLYGMGARFDADPTLMFSMRGIPMEMFLERSVKEKLEMMLDNADHVTDRMLDMCDAGKLFGIVDTEAGAVHEPNAPDMEKMFGYLVLKDAIALHDGGCVTGYELPYGNGHRVTVREPGREVSVTVLTDRYGDLAGFKSTCRCGARCVHEAAAAIAVFGPPEERARKRTDEDLGDISKAIAALGASDDCAGGFQSDEDQFYSDDGYMKSVSETRVMNICGWILEATDDPGTAVWLLDDLQDRCDALGDGGAATAITGSDGRLDAILGGMTAKQLADSLSRERPGISWIFGRLDSVPAHVRRDAAAILGDVQRRTPSASELLFRLGMHDAYLRSLPERERDQGVCRVVNALSDSGDSGGAMRYGALALRRYTRMTPRDAAAAKDLLKGIGVDFGADTAAVSNFLRSPNTGSMRYLASKHPGHDLRAMAFDACAGDADVVPNAVFFADAGMLSAVAGYMDGHGYNLERACGGFPSINVEMLAWLFEEFRRADMYDEAARLARSMVDHILTCRYGQYSTAISLLRTMDGDWHFDSVPDEPHSAYMRRLRKTEMRKTRFWTMYEGSR